MEVSRATSEVSEEAEHLEKAPLQNTASLGSVFDEILEESEMEWSVSTLISSCLGADLPHGANHSKVS